MRLGEIKNIISAVLGDNNTIVIDAAPMYGNQVYEIKNYALLIKALKVVSEQAWNEVGFENIAKIIAKYGEHDEVKQVPTQEYNILQQYIAQVNSKIPVFYGILNTMIKPQDEHVINIKLAEAQNNTLENLSEVNKNIDLILRAISVDGGYEFKGFDVGSSWYEVLIGGALTYKALVGAIDLAQKFFGATEAYFKSKEAQIAYQAAKDKKATNTELRKFAATFKKLELEEAAKELVNKMEVGDNAEEVTTKIVKTVDLLQKQMELGIEFHLSLNPPKYAQEIDGKISINYEEIRAMNADEIPQIEHKEDEE